MDREGFMARWSRRKAAARAAASSASAGEADPATPQPAAAGAVPAPGPAVPDIGEPEALPEADALTGDSDFARYLREGVDPMLRRAALRKLWTLDPVFSHLDGLLEYGEDFTDSAKATVAVRTAYRIAQGVGSAAAAAGHDFVQQGETADEPAHMQQENPGAGSVPEGEADSASDRNA